jgi:fluoroquinolone transport system ATP-binding protein
LTFTYSGAAQPAVRTLTFSITPGEIFGFLGPSGAGKSTTQKVLIGLLRGYGGRVQIFRQDLAQWGASYYERIGVSFETPNHFLKLTARENLQYFARLYSRPTRAPQELLHGVGLGEDGDTPVGKYSKGMKARLSVARALLHNPELLFLDEPTAGLDPVNARRIKDLILEQKRAGKTVFLTTHNMTVAEELCDRVAFIVEGEIRLIDAPRALKLRYGRPRVVVEWRSDEGVRSGEFALDSLADHPEFLSLLRSGSVQTIHTQEATLESVFIQVTGRSLE